MLQQLGNMTSTHAFYFRGIIRDWYLDGCDFKLLFLIKTASPH